MNEAEQSEQQSRDLASLAHMTSKGDGVALRELAHRLPFPRIRLNVRDGSYYLRVGPSRLDVDPQEPRGWEWLGFNAQHICTHQRRADFQVWGPDWVDCVAVPTGVDTTVAGPLRTIGGERANRPGVGPESVIIEGERR